MESRMSIGRTAVWAVAAAVLTTEPAHAYVDPGSASYIVQVLVGAVLGLLFTVRLYWQKIKALFRRGGYGRDTRP
jgi:hypothetical protein